MEFAFVVDPLDSLKAYKDSSVAMMRAAQARGHALFAIEQPQIFWDSGVTRARVQPLEVGPDDESWYRAGDRVTVGIDPGRAALIEQATGDRVELGAGSAHVVED